MDSVKILVAYDSLTGNVEKMANAVAERLYGVSGRGALRWQVPLRCRPFPHARTFSTSWARREGSPRRAVCLREGPLPSHWSLRESALDALNKQEAGDVK